MDTEIESSNHKTSSSAVTNIRLVLEPFYAWKYVLAAVPSGEDIKKIKCGSNLFAIAR